MHPKPQAVWGHFEDAATDSVAEVAVLVVEVVEVVGVVGVVAE